MNRDDAANAQDRLLGEHRELANYPAPQTHEEFMAQARARLGHDPAKRQVSSGRRDGIPRTEAQSMALARQMADEYRAEHPSRSRRVETEEANG